MPAEGRQRPTGPPHHVGNVQTPAAGRSELNNKPVCRVYRSDRFTLAGFGRPVRGEHRLQGVLAVAGVKRPRIHPADARTMVLTKGVYPEGSVGPV